MKNWQQITVILICIAALITAGFGFYEKIQLVNKEIYKSFFKKLPTKKYE
jgi:hypothetical protein